MEYYLSLTVTNGQRSYKHIQVLIVGTPSQCCPNSIYQMPVLKSNISQGPIPLYVGQTLILPHYCLALNKYCFFFYTIVIKRHGIPFMPRCHTWIQCIVCIIKLKSVQLHSLQIAST